MARWPLPVDYTRDERVARLERNLAALEDRGLFHDEPSKQG